MKKLSHLLACSVLVCSFFTLTLSTQAQNPNSGPYAGLIAAGNSITQEAIGATSDANYVANHASGGGNAQQMTSRLNALDNAASRIEIGVAYLQSAAYSIGYAGLTHEVSEISAGAEAFSRALKTCIDSRSAGLPIPAAAAAQVQSILFALRDASPCIRREIQEIQ